MPEVQGVIPTRAIFDVLGLKRFPVAHVEIMGHDARASLHLLPNVRPDHQVYLGQQIHRQDVGAGQIDGADILLADFDEFFDSGFLMFSWDSLIRSGSISKPIALTPYFFAAVTTMRPSPDRDRRRHRPS